jgi:hypothetical protein
MSKVKITGHASGTGTLTLTGPNTNSDRTITLPDSTGTVLTLAGGAMTGALTNFTSTGIDDNANATAITINDRENVGIGVSPKSWNNNMEALQLSSAAAFVGSTGGNGESARMYQNFYNNGAAELYIQDGYACQYSQSSDNGDHKFLTAASGSADGTVSWTNRLEITNDGRGLSQFTAKAWVKYDQINDTVDDSHNVSGVTDIAAGRYRVTFSNDMANANYSAFSCINDRGSFGDDNFVTDTETTASFYVRTKHQNAAGTAYAQDFVSSALIFGD